MRRETTETIRAITNMAVDSDWNLAKDSLSMLVMTKAVVMSSCSERIA